ncbi:hypothetical protein KPH14_004305 [Odynerus spinipes]|uniref:Tubulin--tyrosine ligase-like protein 9 n=1 Tax=Odynerus spinipes TaxID=1348599 RepID=A0AAD9RYS5_9HYME|nr:hypothetical protein KPH14_004305 [Odynerus spinipes]
MDSLRPFEVVDPEDNGWNLWWCETCDVRQVLDSRKLEPNQRIPHFRNHYELTRKNYLCRNLKRYKKLLTKADKQAEAELCDSMPITFELPSEYRMFVEEYQKQSGSTWIVKPVSRSQGRGIFLFRRLKDLIDWRSSRANAMNQQSEVSTETFVVQKYIDDPYLLAGRKFDLRIYVLVTSFHPLKVWLAREGFARLSSELFDLKNINDNRVHLTNMAIQLKKSKGDEENSINNKSRNEQRKRRCKWSLLKFREYLTARHGIFVVETVLQRITEARVEAIKAEPHFHHAGVIMASLLAVQRVMMQGRNSFELYGYDVILDERLTPWLLEVNASPSLSATDPEDYRLKFDLIDDVLNIIDLERRFTAREIRIGGLDLLWNDGPIWASYPNPTICGEENRCYAKKLNVFLGARNDRARQLRQLHEILHEMRGKRSEVLEDSPPNVERSRQ